MTKPILKLFQPSGSPIIGAFLTPCADTKFQGNPIISPNAPPKLAWIGNFKPNGPNIKISISRKITTRSTCLRFARDLWRFTNVLWLIDWLTLGPSNTSHGWSAMTSYQIQDGGRHWPHIVRSSPNVAWQRRYTANLNYSQIMRKYENQRWWKATILKIENTQ